MRETLSEDQPSPDTLHQTADNKYTHRENAEFLYFLALQWLAVRVLPNVMCRAGWHPALRPL